MGVSLSWNLERVDLPPSSRVILHQPLFCVPISSSVQPSGDHRGGGGWDKGRGVHPKLRTAHGDVSTFVCSLSQHLSGEDERISEPCGHDSLLCLGINHPPRIFHAHELI